MTVAQPLAENYLRQLARAARVLPHRQRADLLAEIRSHLDEGLPPEASEADIRTLLDEMGSPAEIVAAAQADRPQAHRGAREVFALVLLVTGIPPVLGWVVGLALLLSSPLWTPRQKLLGTLIWPGGYVGVAAAMAMLAVAVPYGGAYLGVTIAVLAVIPLLVAGYLFRAAGRRANPS